MKIVCETCGSEDVRRDAWAAWDVENQCWELCEVFDHAHCHTCEGDTSLMEVADDQSPQMNENLSGLLMAVHQIPWIDPKKQNEIVKAHLQTLLNAGLIGPSCLEEGCYESTEKGAKLLGYA